MENRKCFIFPTTSTSGGTFLWWWSKASVLTDRANVAVNCFIMMSALNWYFWKRSDRGDRSDLELREDEGGWGVFCWFFVCWCYLGIRGWIGFKLIAVFGRVGFRETRLSGLKIETLMESSWVIKESIIFQSFSLKEVYQVLLFGKMMDEFGTWTDVWKDDL